MRLTKLFGAPFVRGGRDVKIGLDCQGLFLEAMRAFGNEVEDTDTAEYATEVVAGLISEAIENGKWEKIDAPEEGCAVAIALDSIALDKTDHLGVFIGENKFIHILEKRGVVTNRIDDKFFRNKIRGFYRWIGNNNG